MEDSGRRCPAPTHSDRSGIDRRGNRDRSSYGIVKGSWLPLHEPALGGDHHELEAVRSADLIEHTGEVVLDRFLADGALAGDFLVGASGNHQRQYFTFARSETVGMFEPGAAGFSRHL